MSLTMMSRRCSELNILFYRELHLFRLSSKVCGRNYVISSDRHHACFGNKPVGGTFSYYDRSSKPSVKVKAGNLTWRTPVAWSSTTTSSTPGSLEESGYAVAEPYSSESQPDDVVQPSEELMLSLCPEDQKRMKVLVLEREVFRQSGYPTPDKMSDSLWQDIFSKDTRSQRLKFYRFLRINENHEIRHKEKKAERREVRLAELRSKPVDDSGHIEYGLNKNTIFQMLRETNMNQFYNHWQCQGIRFGQNIVVDLSYDEFMNKMECGNCADQIKDMYATNRVNREPFHFHVCNARSGDPTYEHLQMFLPNLHLPSNLMSIQSQSYMDLFPKEKLVYLTPHCKEELRTYDHDAVYIIGGIVDKTVQRPVSLAKAKREGIAMAKLPLDIYLDWGSSGKNLTLDQMMKIMLDIKNTGDWATALRHVPQRKLKREDYVPQSPKFSYRF